MLLLTGATGTIGLPLLRRLTAQGVPVRCLVRDPRRLGPERVRVQIALGDLADPFSFRNALRGVDTVVHLAAATRDQPAGSIEELAGVASWRLVRAAERAGAERFVFFSTLGASTRSRARLLRAKAIAERALGESSLAYTVFAPSLVYSPSDPFITLLERMSLLPVMPISGAGRASFQPMWAEDVADCVMAVLPGGSAAEDSRAARYELAGPETFTYLEFVTCVLRSLRRRRPVVKIPTPIVCRTLNLLELLMGPAAPATWDEAELLEVSLIARKGTADAERLGVLPKPLRAVLGVGQLNLRRATLDDLAFLVDLAGDDAVARFLHTGAGDEEALQARLAAGGAEGRDGLFVIEHSGDHLVGALELSLVNQRSAICQLSRLMVSPAYRRTGVASRAVWLACRAAFEDHGIHRVQAEVYGDNVVGQKLFERVGFTREGVRRRAYRRREQWLDGILYGLLAEELPRRRPG